MKPGLTLFVLLAAACGETVPDEAGEALFDGSVLHDVRIDMDARRWTLLKSDPERDLTNKVTVTIDGWQLSDVGLVSRNQDTRTGEKPGLELQFNHFDGDKSFGKLQSLKLRNLYGDPSGLRQYLASQVHVGLNLPAPRASFARVTVNGEYVGLYGVLENVDRVFLAARFSEEGGNLFQVEPQSDAWGFGPLASYVPMPFEPQTNQGAPGLGDGLSAFIGELSAASDDELLDALAPYLDTAQFLTFLAAEMALADPFGFTGVAGASDFFAYQEENTTKFVFIPWNRDFALTNVDQSIFFRVDTNVLTRRLLALPQIRAGYREILGDTVNSFVNDTFLATRLEAAYQLIRSSMREDPHKIYSDLGVDEANVRFESAVGDLRLVVQGRAASVAAQLAADAGQ